MSRESVALVERFIGMAHCAYKKKYPYVTWAKDDLIQAGIEEMCMVANTHTDDGRMPTRMYCAAVTGMQNELRGMSGVHVPRNIDFDFPVSALELYEDDKAASIEYDDSLLSFSDEELPILIMRANGFRMSEIRKKLGVTRWQVDKVMKDVRIRYGYPDKPLGRIFVDRGKNGR